MSPVLPSRCPVCGSGATVDVLEIPSVPVYCNVLWPERQAAMDATRGALRLTFCPACAHIFNASYDADLTDYTIDYDNSLHFSAHFNHYAEALAGRLVERYSLRGKTLVEIGCGKGDFLVLLCDQGGNRGWGFDRSFDPARVDERRRQRISFVQEFYTAEQTNRLRPDFVCCRHVLEHLAAPRSFLEELRGGFADRTDAVVYLEVPNALFTVKDMGIWDLIYEHCSYFTLGSLTHAATSSGFDVLDMGEAYGGQFIFVELRPGTGRPLATVPEAHQPAAVGRYVGPFAERYRDRVAAWRGRLRDLRRAGRSVVVWGGGSKGVTFLNGLGLDSGIEYVVDLNPHKQGKYVAGTGQRVVAPDSLRTIRPTDIIVMNPIYESEIAGVVETLGVDARLSCV